MKKIYLYTHYWGGYRGLFEQYTFPSVILEKRTHLREDYQIKWLLYCDTFSDYIGEFSDIEIVKTVSHNIMETLHPVLRRCVNEDAMLVIVSPDYLIGNDSIYNGIKLIEGKDGMCLSVAHPRVSSFLMGAETIDCKDLSNRHLVEIAFRNRHYCFVNAFDNNPSNMTWAGLSIRQITPDMMAVIHNLATPFILQPKEEDLVFLNRKDNTCLDREFIGYLQGKDRIKLCGSSDLCFFVEVTADNNTPPVEPNLLNNDKDRNGNNYWNNTIVLWIR